jgi:hypothetical protein
MIDESMRTTVVTCPDCDGLSIERSDIGGLAYGGCQLCGGTGLIHA